MSEAPAMLKGQFAIEGPHCHLGLGKLYRRTDRREQADAHLTTATTMYRLGGCPVDADGLIRGPGRLETGAGQWRYEPGTKQECCRHHKPLSVHRHCPLFSGAMHLLSLSNRFCGACVPCGVELKPRRVRKPHLERAERRRSPFRSGHSALARAFHRANVASRCGGSTHLLKAGRRG